MDLAATPKLTPMSWRCPKCAGRLSSVHVQFPFLTRQNRFRSVSKQSRANGLKKFWRHYAIVLASIQCSFGVNYTKYWRQNSWLSTWGKISGRTGNPSGHMGICGCPHGRSRLDRRRNEPGLAQGRAWASAGKRGKCDAPCALLQNGLRETKSSTSRGACGLGALRSPRFRGPRRSADKIRPF